MTLFDQNPYLNLIGFSENAVFDVFPKNSENQTLLETPLVYDHFPLFSKYQVFPRTSSKSRNIHKILDKNPKFTGFGQNVTDRSDVCKTSLFDPIFMKFSQFCTFPLGLDRGWCTSVSMSYRGCPLVSSGVEKCHFWQKPLGLDRGFRQKD